MDELKRLLDLTIADLSFLAPFSFDTLCARAKSLLKPQTRRCNVTICITSTLKSSLQNYKLEMENHSKKYGID